MPGGESYGSGPEAVHLSAGSQPGSAPAGKGGGSPAFFQNLQGRTADERGRAAVSLCKSGRGAAFRGRTDVKEDAGYGYGRGAHRSQRYDAAVLFASVSGAVPQAIPKDQGNSDQCPYAGNHSKSGRGKNRLWCGDYPVFLQERYPKNAGKAHP